MKTAFIFPGQGAQYFGMGKDFYDNFKASKNIFDCASDVLHMDIPKLCFEENDKLNITEYTQAALFTTCAAMYEAIKDINEETAEVAAGLSLGEYSALYCCGAFEFEEAIACVRKRGIYMQESVPPGQGSMSAVIGLSQNIVEKICEETEGIVNVANYNCPGQVAISGETEAVRKAGERLSDAGALRIVELNVSGPFHSPLLKEAGEKLEPILKDINWNQLKIPYVSNVTAKYIYDVKDTSDLLKKQVSAPVRWQQSVETMLDAGIDRFIEIGPGHTLKKLVRKVSKKAAVINIEKVEDVI